ncbi:MAG: hypothetical protein RR365_08970 [Bacteroides sp.]
MIITELFALLFGGTFLAGKGIATRVKDDFRKSELEIRGYDMGHEMDLRFMPEAEFRKVYQEKTGNEYGKIDQIFLRKKAIQEIIHAEGGRCTPFIGPPDDDYMRIMCDRKHYKQYLARQQRLNK